jgi:hypothetical protein
MSHPCYRRGCDVVVPDHLLACRGDWFALSRPVRAAVWETYRMTGVAPTAARRAALRAAQEEWAQMGASR